MAREGNKGDNDDVHYRTHWTPSYCWLEALLFLNLWDGQTTDPSLSPFLGLVLAFWSESSDALPSVRTAPHRTAPPRTALAFNHRFVPYGTVHTAIRFLRCLRM
jgi:hypothetical protein